MKKMNKQVVLEKVKTFVERAKAISKLDFGKERQGQWAELAEEIEQFDHSLGPGLTEGCVVAWPCADESNAEYFVTSIGKQYVHLVWSQTSDLESPVVVNGRAMRAVVDIAMEGRNFHHTIRNLRRSKPNP